MKFYEDIIRRPVLSEKTYDMIGDQRYVFVVDRRAKKVEIKKAVESIFDVQVAKVNTVTTTGKVKRMGRSEGRTPTTKKAYVILKKDSKPIAFFEGMAD